MRIFLDTDIGTDVDDALALAMILGSPELDLVGISTVYGDTLLRARLASRLVSLAQPGLDIPIAAGEQRTLSGREVWWPGHEGALYTDLDREPIDPEADGVGLLLESAARFSGQLDVLAIGPLTDIATALDRSPAFERDVRTLVVMGGDFRADSTDTEHNLDSDVTAAQRVFDSGLDIVVGGLDLTTQAALTREHVDLIAEAGDPGRILSAEIAQWWDVHATGESNNPHDPILVAWMVEPRLFSEARVSVRIDDDGRSVHRIDDTGRVRLLTGMDVRAVTTAIVDRVRAGGSRTSRETSSSST